MQIYMGNSFKNVDFATKIDDYSVYLRFISSQLMICQRDWR